MTKLHALALLPFAILLKAVPADAERMTVKQVIENKDRLDGKIVTVSGWLPECEGLNCILYESPESTTAGPDSERSNYHLGIGDYRVFERKAAGRLPAFVVLRARFHGECVAPSKLICLDRIEDLSGVQILRLDEH